MEELKKKWAKWGIDEKTQNEWLQFKDEQYLKDITAETEARAKTSPGGLLRHKIKSGDVIARVETRSARQEPEIRIYSRDENVRWYHSLTEEEKFEAYDFASWKFPWLPVHMSSAKVSYLDDVFIGHWLFGMYMEILGRNEREAFDRNDPMDRPRMAPSFLKR